VVYQAPCTSPQTFSELRGNGSPRSCFTARERPWRYATWILQEYQVVRTRSYHDHRCCTASDSEASPRHLRTGWRWPGHRPRTREISCRVRAAMGKLPASGCLLTNGVMEVYWYVGEMCGTVTPPSADCESSICGWQRVAGLAACNIVGHTPGVEPILPQCSVNV